MKDKLLKDLIRIKQETTTITYDYSNGKRKLGEKKVVTDYLDKNMYEMLRGIYSKIMEKTAEELVATKIIP